MDERQLSDALRRATDDVAVPRDLVRRAQRLGRERRARRRSGAVGLAVTTVVLAGGALAVTQGGGSDSASSTGSSAAGSAAGGPEAAPAPAPSESAAPAPAAPTPAVPEAAGGDGQGAVEDATCDPALVVDGVPARSGYATPVRAGDAVEIGGAALPCARVEPGTRYPLVLAPGGSQTPTVLAEVAPAGDGSFSARVTVPASTAPGPARLSVEGSAWEQAPCPDSADCLRLDYGADLDVLPPEIFPEGSP